MAWVGAHRYMSCRKFCKGSPPWIVCVRGGRKIFARGPPLFCEACKRGGLASLVARVGAHWVGAVRRKCF